MEASIKLETVEENGVWHPLRAAHESTSVQHDASRLAKDSITKGVVDTASVPGGSHTNAKRSAT